MFDLIYDYFISVIFNSESSELSDLMDSLAIVSTIFLIFAILLVIFGFMKRALFWVGSMFGGDFI